jgi:O-antigen/teichoic acid export membrane protein
MMSTSTPTSASTVRAEPAAVIGARWWHRVRTDGLARFFGFMAVAQIVAALLGLVYWIVAARLVPSREVGLGASAVATVMLLSMFATMGLSTLLVAELKHAPAARRRLLLSTSLLVAALASVLIGGIWVAVAPHLGAGLGATGGRPVASVLLVLGVVVTTMASVFDYGALGIGAGRVQLVRNIAAALVKLALLPVMVAMGARTGVGLLATWDVSMAVSLLLSVNLLRHVPAARPRGRERQRLAIVREMTRAALSHHALNLMIEGAGAMLPVLAAMVVAPRELAYFSSARLIVAGLFMLPWMLTVALFAATVGDEDALRERVRQTLAVGLGLNIAFVLGFAVLGRRVLAVFGGEYAHEGALALLLLVLGGVPLVVKDHYVAIRRSQRRLARAARVVAAGTVLEAIGGIVGGRTGGLTGFCIGWLIALGLEAAAVLPIVVAFARDRGHMTSGGTR